MDFTIDNVVHGQSKGLTWMQAFEGKAIKAGDLLNKLPHDLQDSVCHAIKVTGARDTSDIIEFWKERTQNPNGTIPLNLLDNKNQIMNHYFRMINSAGRVPETGSLHLQKIVKAQTSIAKKELQKLLKNSGSRNYSEAEIDGMAHLTTSKCVLAGLTADAKKTATPRAGYFTMKDIIHGRQALTTLKWSAALVIGAALIGYVIYPWYRKMRGEARKTIEKFDDITKQPGIHEVMNKIEMSNGNFNPNRTDAPRFTNSLRANKYYSPVKVPPTPPPPPSPFKYKKPKKPFFRIIHPDDLKKEQEADKRNEADQAAAYAKRHGISIAAVKSRGGARVPGSTTAASKRASTAAAKKAAGPQTCRPDQIVNPDTGYCVKRTGAIGQSILAKASISTATTQRAAAKPATSRTRTAPATYTQYY
jgi:hypothetical protein